MAEEAVRGLAEAAELVAGEARGRVGAGESGVAGACGRLVSRPAVAVVQEAPVRVREAEEGLEEAVREAVGLEVVVAEQAAEEVRVLVVVSAAERARVARAAVGVRAEGLDSGVAEAAGQAAEEVRALVVV